MLSTLHDKKSFEKETGVKLPSTKTKWTYQNRSIIDAEKAIDEPQAMRSWNAHEPETVVRNEFTTKGIRIQDYVKMHKKIVRGINNVAPKSDLFKWVIRDNVNANVESVDDPTFGHGARINDCKWEIDSNISTHWWGKVHCKIRADIEPKFFSSIEEAQLMLETGNVMVTAVDIQWNNNYDSRQECHYGNVNETNRFDQTIRPDQFAKIPKVIDRFLKGAGITIKEQHSEFRDKLNDTLKEKWADNGHDQSVSTLDDILFDLRSAHRQKVSRNKKHKNRKLMKEIEKLEHKIAKTDDIRNTIYNKIISMPDIEIRDIAFSLDNKLKKEHKFHGRNSQYLYRRRRR